MGLQSTLVDFHAALKPQTSEVGGCYAATREFFIRGISACFFAAFASFLLQVPGLYGKDGIMPTTSCADMDKTCLQGLLLSCLGLFGFGNVFVLYAMVSWYSFLVEAAPSPFYNFQWDELILEAGFMAAVLAPLLHSSLEPRPSSAAIWMVRFILFKLMLMSGVVKITSGDTHWTQLTAIWYHFASQCIPMPFAWYFHNLPMVLEKAFCAIMFMIEIPSAFLILVPVREVQLLAAFLQISLQLVILVSGNYTFFNYLTILLACILIQDDLIPSICRPANHSKRVMAFLGTCGAGTAATESAGGVATDILTPDAARAESRQAEEETAPLLQESDGTTPATSADGHQIVRATFLSVLGWSCCGLCLIWVIFHAVTYGFNFGLKATVTPNSLLNWTSWWVPTMLIYMSIVIPVVTLMDIYCVAAVDHAALSESSAREQRQVSPRIKVGVVSLASLIAIVLLVIRGMVCLRMLSFMPHPMSEVAPSLRSRWTRTSLWQGVPKTVSYTETMPLGLPHYGPYPYGLFRVMTGVGEDGSVARPELNLEVRDAKGAWTELQFRYKPGDVSRRPPIIAPYQPRLDWQMWFQALSPYPDDWFDSLLNKIENGSPAVLALLDPSSLPNVKVDALRVRAYSYNFTTYGQPGWWRRTPVDEGADVGRTFLMTAPVNLAQAYRQGPWDWRTLAVWGFVILVTAFYIAPICVNLEFKRIFDFGPSTAESKAD